MSLRRPHPCRACTSVHRTCYSQEDDLNGPCSRCASAGLACSGRDSQAGILEQNAKAELRAQLGRLDTYVRTLEVYEPQEADGFKLDDLVDRLTGLCFSSESLAGPAALTEPNEMLDAAKDHMVEEKRLHEKELDNGGFVLQSEDMDLDDLAASLPPWQEIESMLLALADAPTCSTEPVYTPATIRAVDDLYASGLATPPHPHQLADIFAMLLSLEISLASQESASTKVPPVQAMVDQHQQRAEHWRSLCMRALELGNHLEDPTLMSLRAFVLSSSVYLTYSPNTAPLRRALVALPLQIALLYQLGYNAEPADPHQEDPVQRFERRALATLVARKVWWFSVRFGHKVAIRGDTFTCAMPEPLSQCGLPLDPKYECFRADVAVIRSVALRTKGALLRDECFDRLSKAPRVSTAELKEMGGRLRDVAELTLADDWGATLSLNGKRACVWALTSSLTTVISFHQHFCLVQPGVDMDYHRGELMWALRAIEPLLVDFRQYIGSMPSVTFSAYDMLVISAVLLSKLSSATPSEAEQTVSDGVLRTFFDMHQGTVVPRVSLRLARLLQFLLNREKTGEGDVKRRRTEAARPGRYSTMLAAQQALKVETAAEPFTFSSSICLPIVDGGSPAAAKEVQGKRVRA